MHPLDGPRLKLKRAKQHLNTINRALRAYYSLQPYGFVVEPYPPTGHKVVRVRVDRVPPDRIGVFIGECLYNLRSALDQIAWALASRDGRIPPDRIQFPILEHEPVSSNARQSWRQQTSGIGEPDSLELEVIKSLQPYTRGSGVQLHPLFLLDDWRNADAHRNTPVLGHMLRIRLPKLPGLALPDIDTVFNDGDIIMHVGSGFQLDSTFNPLIAARVAFGVGKPGHARQAPPLDSIYEFVRTDVFPRFTGFFE